ncbi:MAG: PDZ domain-containing protein [Acidobacteriota bacterium]|nr:PDZ domain-containing protein [Acidobacteriota bacterium]MDE3043272.1 PDZ domain-containing protein [Acidobacteriota bacterium]MDE3107576.1 PDZ domain-containing protein [Acidobacteriota bacterium]MDE3222718.1 PDZ domain-containing protein [Acidobacteriota bacterium]
MVWWGSKRGWRRRGSPPPVARRTWVHPSELPNFETLPTTSPRVRSARALGVVALLLALLGGTVLLANRGHAVVANTPSHLAASFDDLPAVAQRAAVHLIDLTITTPGHVANVPALVLGGDLAVTTTKIPVNALLTASTTKKINFPVTLLGRDDVLNFSVVRLGERVRGAQLAALPSSAPVTAIATIERGSTKTPSYRWSATSMGDPTLNRVGVVRYLATQSDTSMSAYVDAIAIDAQGDVVAVLSARHLWYPATFVARVARVVATGHGCHAGLGVSGTSAQGGGALIQAVRPFSPAAHALLHPGDILTSVNGTPINSWSDLTSTLYLTPAYAKAQLVFEHHGTLHHADVTLNCDL